MAWEHRFRLPQIPCSNMETVSWSFVVLQDKDINQGKFKRYWQVQQRGGYSKMEDAFYRLKMLSDDTPMG